ncbi:phospho-sugar mutase [Schaalia sp. 19OD2882]|uniref:phospho-sugar mutase n=1 Tax=Schaalia sp. 19OD2882 TaxID=2794089 RepID=UPI001C1EF319|nr:phospho-sugar mutase [Schaalia sp. 19OD2882]QWW20061.1 phospho-sugar mutase [Schaalia sp. 19OD2882]
MTISDTSAIESWIADDPDATTASELRALLDAATGGDAAAEADLADRFNGQLTFGTAGLRGHLGGGPNRMNRAVVIRAAAGLVDVLKRRTGGDFTLVIGHDARHGSHQFALDTAAVAVAAGGRALVLPRALPTPVAAFALRHLEADAAVVVTASHNPPEDNGYKVYLGGKVVTDSGQGTQIVPPFDSEIFEAIQKVPSVASVPRAESGWEVLGEDLVEAYLDQVTSLVPSPAPEGADALRIVLTSMHGVGGETMLRALHMRGFHDVHVVAEQHEPDPEFPTVRFPNPEEPGALDLSYALARKVDADLILANDPDADRCSAAVPDASSPTGWRQLTGDEVGSLLGEQTARLHEGDSSAVLANSIVSSRQLARIAAAHGVSHAYTLTGFKWISRVPGLVFGYEEALGYCVDPEHVRDKDGISACLRLAAFAATCKAHGRTMTDELDALALTHGLHATAPLTIRVEDLSIIATGMANLRANGIASMAGSPVVESIDLASGSDSLPPTDGLLFRTEAGDQVVARPSGTEPKLKCYLEVIVPVEGGDVAAARRVAAERLEAIKADVRTALGV